MNNDERDLDRLKAQEVFTRATRARFVDSPGIVNRHERRRADAIERKLGRALSPKERVLYGSRG
jgi:hypothetical protein